jgi:putative hydrolase of the HAD superfamily
VIKAVLLDLDDTCYSQAEYLDGALGAVATRAACFGVSAPALLDSLTEIAAQGSDRGRIIDRALAAIGADAPVSPLVAAFRDYRPAVLTPYPGVLEALRELRGWCRTALVTDGDPDGQRAKVHALGLGDLFDAVVLSDELGRDFRKPHPAPFQAALAALGVSPAEAVFVGDRPDKDILGAVRVGVRAVRVRTGEYRDRDGDEPPWLDVPDLPAALRALTAVASST